MMYSKKVNIYVIRLDGEKEEWRATKTQVNKYLSENPKKEGIVKQFKSLYDLNTRELVESIERTWYIRHENKII